MKRPRAPNGVSATDHGQRFHELFGPIEGVSPPDYRPEPIYRIYVTRFDTSGPVQALRPFGPAELTDNAAIVSRFGGGTYELIARRDNGTIYAKRQITLPGAPKSMTGDDTPATPGFAQPQQAPQPSNGFAAPAIPGMPMAPGMDPMHVILAFVMQQNQQQQAQALAQMTMLGQVMVAALSGKGDGAGEAARLVSETMKSTIEMMKANVPPPAAPVSPITAAKEMLEVARMINPPPTPPKPPPPKEETASDVINALAGALGPFAQMAISAAQGGAKALAGAPAASPLPVG